jgi:hypothetical protein
MGYSDERPQPALLLVGDHGVYLMSNGKPGLPHPDKPEPANFVIYADGCNPDVDDFDSWWNFKRATFGADDGAETLTIIDELAKLINRNPKATKFIVEFWEDDRLNFAVAA